MAGFASFDELINAITVDGQVNETSFMKRGSTAEAAGVWHSFWAVGDEPAAGAAPAAGSGTPGAGGTAYDLTDGGLSKWADVDPSIRNLVTVEAQATQDCTLMLYDRLVGVGSIALTGTGNKNVNSTALLRYTGGVGVEAWLEITSITSTNAVILSMNSYTDQDGNGTAAGGSITFPSTAMNVDSMVGPLPLATGDYGVRSVETINVSTASGGSTATCNLILIKPLAYLPLLANLGASLDLVSMIPSLPRLYDGHTLGLMYLPTVGTAMNVWGQLRAAYN